MRYLSRIPIAVGERSKAQRISEMPANVRFKFHAADMPHDH